MSGGRYVMPTSWGELRIDWHGDDVVGIALPGRHLAYDSSGVPPRLVRAFALRLAAWFDGEVDVQLAEPEQLDSWLAACGITGFTARALRVMASVAPGTTVTYRAVAELAGQPAAARAVGNACARNPLPIVVACHRVLPADGSIGSYGPGGSELKQLLLEHEGWRRSDPRERLAVGSRERATRIPR